MTLTMVPKQKPLTVREALFVEELLKHGNQSEAYRAAGYKSKTPHVHASQLVARSSIRSEIERRRSAAMVTLERNTIATLGEVKEKLTAQLRGADFSTDLTRLEAELATLVGPARFDASMEIARLKVAMSSEAAKAALTLARLKGALDPARKPIPDRKAALDSLILAIAKATDGPTLEAKMNEIGFT